MTDTYLGPSMPQDPRVLAQRVPPKSSPATPPGQPLDMDRLHQLLKLREDAYERGLKDTLGRWVDPPVEDPKERRTMALRAFSGFLQANPDQHDAVRAYVSGKTDMVPEGWEISNFPVEAPERHIAKYMREQRGPVLNTVTDLLRAGGAYIPAMAQMGLDIAFAGPRLFGADIHAPDVQAELHRLFQPAPGKGGAFGHYDRAALAEAEYREAPIEARGLQDVARFIGGMRGLGIGKTAKAADLTGKVATTAEKVITAPGRMTMGAGSLLGGMAGRGLAMRASPELKALAEAYGGGAGAFGLLEYLLAHDDKGQPVVGGLFSLDRLEALGWGAAAGAALHKMNQVASNSFQGMLETRWRALGKTEQDALTAMRDWGTQNFRQPYRNEVMVGPNGYLGKMKDAWFNAGAPNMPAIPIRKLLAYGRRGTMEMPGYSLLDEQFREELGKVMFHPELSPEERIEAAQNVLYKMVVNSVGAGTLHAMHMPLADLPGMQRRRPTQAPARQQPSTSVQGEQLPELPELPPGEGRGGSAQQGVEPPRVTRQERLEPTSAREYAEGEATRQPEPQGPMPAEAPPGTRYLPGVNPDVLNRPKQPQVGPGEPEPAVDPAADLVRQGWRPPFFGPDVQLPTELTNLQSPLERAGYDLIRTNDGIVTIRHRETKEQRQLSEKEFYDEFGRHKEQEPQPEEVHHQKDDTRREFMAQQAREFPEGEITVPVGSNVANLALRFFPQKSRAYQDLRAAAEANGGAVRFTKEEARRFIDYHSRSAPRRRQAKTGDEGVEQSNIQALDSLMEKMVDAFGLAKEPPRGEKREGPPPGPGQPAGEPYRGDITREPQKYDPDPPPGPRHPRESERGSFDPTILRDIAKDIKEGVRELLLEGTDHRIIISSDGKEAMASPKLAKMLGASGPMPVEEMLDQVAWMGRLSGLKAMTDLPGTRIGADQVFAVPGQGDEPPKAYTIRMGELVQADLVPGELKWRTPQEPIPARGPDVIDAPQRQAADALTEILNMRSDLSERAGKELDAIITVLRKVNGVNDEGVYETMQMMPDIVRGLTTGSPRHAERLIQAASEMLTTKTPDVAIEDMARARQKTEMDFAIEAMRNADPEMSVAEARTHLEGVMRTVEGDEILRKGLFQSTKTRTDPYSGKQVPVRESPGESGMARIPTEEEVQEAVRRVQAAAGDAASVPAKYLRGYYQGLIERVEALGERDIAQNIGWGGVTKSKEFASRYSAAGRLMDLRRTDRDVMDSLGELGEPDANRGYADLNLRAMDRFARQHWGEAELTGEQRDVVEMQQALRRETQDVAEELGIQQTDVHGKNPRPFRAGAEVLVREYTPDMHIEMLNRAGPRYDALMNWISATYGEPRAQVERTFSDARSLTQLDATEIRRAYPYLPSHIDIAGFSRPVRIFETRPLEHAEALARRSASVMGARSVMPRFPEAAEGGETLGTPAGLEPLSRTAQQLVDSVLNSGRPNARMAAEAVADMVRAMHNLPLFRERWMIRPGEKGYDLVRIGKALLGPVKAGKLTMAFARNVFEAVANAPYFGMGAIGRGVRTVLESIADGSFAEKHRQMVEEGWVADTKINSPWKGDRPVETFEAMMKKAGEVLTSMLRGTQDFNELVFSEAARERLAEMQEGHGSHGDFTALKKLGFSNAEAQTMMRGEGTPEQYNRYRRNIIGQLAAGKSKSSAERPLLAHSATARSLLWFQDFFQARTAALAQLAKDIREAETGEERAMAGAKLLQFAAMTTASGALGTLFVNLISGSDDMVNYLRETTAQDSLDMGKDLLGLFASGIVGGLGQPIAEGFEAITDPGSALEKGGNALIRGLGPLGVGLEFADFVRALGGGDVPGYENMSPLEKTAKYVRNAVPAGRRLHEGLFGLSAIAITEKDPKLDAAQDSYYRWRRDNKPFDESARREEDRATKDAMRAVMDKLAAGKRWGDKDLEQAIIEALHAKQGLGTDKPFSMKEARTYVADSLEARRSLPQPGDRGWTKPQREKLMAHLGDKNVQILRDHDLILTQLAKHIRPLTIR